MTESMEELRVALSLSHIQLDLLGALEMLKFC